MNAQVNPDSIHNLSTAEPVQKPARNQLIPSVVRKDRDGDWIGKTTWAFPERPKHKLDDSEGEWVIQLRTSKGSRGIQNHWQVQQNYGIPGSGFSGTRFMMYGDYSLCEMAANKASRATSKAIAEAHTLAVQQIERIAAAAVEFYKAKQPQG